MFVFTFYLLDKSAFAGLRRLEMERDDIIEYSLDAHHSEETGRKIRKTIWQVTLLMAIITTVEVALGAY